MGKWKKKKKSEKTPVCGDFFSLLWKGGESGQNGKGKAKVREKQTERNGKAGESVGSEGGWNK